jgi:hypothetical protein
MNGYLASAGWLPTSVGVMCGTVPACATAVAQVAAATVAAANIAAAARIGVLIFIGHPDGSNGTG